MLEQFEIPIRDFEWRFPLGACGLFDLVLAFIDVSRHVADVGDVHHVTHAIAVELERTSEAVDENIRAHVAEMLRQVHRGAA